MKKAIPSQPIRPPQHTATSLPPKAARPAAMVEVLKPAARLLSTSQYSSVGEKVEGIHDIPNHDIPLA